MQDLPIGIQNFEEIRKNDYLYVDKTAKLLPIVRKSGKSYFLSRPRRFGKSLTLSTLEAMFKGKAELFKGLYAEEWVKEQAKNPNPVIKLDMSCLDSFETKEKLNKSLVSDLKHCAYLYKLDITEEEAPKAMFKKVVYALYERFGLVVVLIDEYDKPITDNINNLEKAEEMRETLSDFYSALKGSPYIKFVMVTGVSKFSKVGILSGLNNLKDISMVSKYGDIVGYTQKELENNFGEWLDNAEEELSIDREELLKKIKEYYDGFSFDGKTNVYNPFSILNFFDESDFKNFWYVSGSPSFLRNYLLTHRIKNPDKYEEITVPKNFSDKREIESASVESFLYQAGYLTIKEKLRNEFVIGYPNEEVRSSLADMYLDDIYRIEGYITLGNDIWKALEDDNTEKLVKSFNLAIAGLPYDDFGKKEDKLLNEIKEEKRSEFWYRSMFVMLLRGAGVIYYAEVHTYKGRPDVVIVFKDKVIVVEFKLAKNSSEVEKKRQEGLEQIKSRDYSSAYEGSNKKVINLVLVADDEKRQLVM